MPELMDNAAYFGGYRTRSFAEIFPDFATFQAVYQESAFPDMLLTGTGYENFGLSTIFSLLMARYFESHIATDSEDAQVKMYTEYAAAVVGKDGKILAALTDATQPKITADKNGQITGAEFKGTKRELGADYGMVAYGSAIAEWDAQAKAFADYTVGKTAAEVAGIETTVNDSGHNVTTDETLLASCTMDVSGMIAVIALAANYAR